MNMTLLNTFLAVVETGSFTQAARDTFVTQPAVSQHIRALEEKLGVKLFVRHGQRIHLTAEGEELWRHTKAIMKTVEEAEFALKEMSALKRGRLRIGATTYMAYLLPPVIMEFKRRHPLVQITVCFHNSAEVLALVESGAVDLGFAGGITNRPASLGAVPIHVERLALIAPPDHPLVGHGEVRPEDLHDHILAVREEGTYTRRCVAEWFGSVPLPSSLIEVGRIEAAIQLAMNGCLTFVPEGTIKVAPQSRRLVRLPARGLTSDMEYSLYLYGGTIPSLAARVFLELLSEFKDFSKAKSLKQGPAHTVPAP